MDKLSFLMKYRLRVAVILSFLTVSALLALILRGRNVIPVPPPVIDQDPATKEIVKPPMRILVLPFANGTKDPQQWYYSLGFVSAITSALGQEENIEIVQMTYEQLANAAVLVKDGKVPTAAEIAMFAGSFSNPPTHVLTGSFSGIRSYEPKNLWTVTVNIQPFDGSTLLFDVYYAKASTTMLSTRTELCTKVVEAKMPSEFCEKWLEKQGKAKKPLKEKKDVFDNFFAFSAVAQAVSSMFSIMGAPLSESAIGKMATPSTYDDMALKRFVRALDGERGYFSLDAKKRVECTTNNGKIVISSVKTEWVKTWPKGKKQPPKWVEKEKTEFSAQDCFLADVQDALRRDPNYSEALLFNAYLLAESGKYVEAKTAYANVLSREKDNTVAISALAKISFDLKEYQNAIKYFSTLTTLYPGSSIGFYWLGRSHEALNDMEKAKIAYEKSAMLDTVGVEAKYSLVQQFAQKEDFISAIVELERITRLKPDQRFAWYMLAAIQRRLHRIDDAAVTYAMAKALTPNDPLLTKFEEWVRLLKNDAVSQPADQGEGAILLSSLDTAPALIQLLEKQRKDYAKIFDDLLWKVSPENGERATKCTESITSGALLAHRKINEFMMTKAKIDAIAMKLLDAKGAGHDFFFTPDELTKAKIIVDRSTAAKQEQVDMATQYDQTLQPLITRIGCNLPSSLPTSTSIPVEAYVPATQRVVVMPDSPPRDPAPTSPQFNPSTTKFAKVVIDNPSDEVYLFSVEKAVYDKEEIAANTKMSFLVPIGQHTYCLVPKKDPLQCGDPGTSRTWNFYGMVELQVLKK